MKIKINYSALEELLKQIGAKPDSNNLDQDCIEFVSKLQSKSGLEVSSLDDVEYDDEGYLIAYGQRIVLYIKDSKNDIEKLRNDPRGENVVRYHIHGQCRTLQGKKANGTYDRYVLKAKPNGLFVVDGVTGGKKNRYGGLIYGTGTIVTEEDVALGICKNCLNEIGIGHQKSAQEWRDSFDIEDFFKKLKPLKPSKPKYTETTYPGIEKRYDREYQRKSKQLKQLNNYRCSACDVDLNSSLSHRRLLHCHHKDGNDRIHANRNLQLLCVDCHAKIGSNKNPGFPGDLELCRKIKAEQGIHG